MIRSIAFLFLPIVFIVYISAEWYQSQVIVMESWAYILKDGQQATEDTLDTVLSESIESTTLQEDSTAYDNAVSRLNESELKARNLAIEMFSGAIYGYDFSYAPPNSRRQVQEKWTITPVAKIPLYNTQLIELERNILDGTLRIFYRYNLVDQQVRLLQSWEERSKVLHSRGEGISLNNNAEGSAIIEDGYADSRIDALYDAIQSAIRNRMKDTLPQATRIVYGRVRLASQPFFTDYIDYYRARTTVMLYINSVHLYEDFL